MTHNSRIAYFAIDTVDDTQCAHIKRTISECAVLCDNHDAVDICVLHAQDLNVDVLQQIGSICNEFRLSSLLLLTPDCDQQGLLKAYQNGISEHLSLPVEWQLLQIKLERLLSAKRVQKQQAEKNLQLEEVLARIQQEENFAHHVYEEITGGALNNHKDYFSMQHSASGFCGDFLFDMRSPTGIRYIFLADAMGHGLAAALSILPVIHVVKAMANRSMPLSTILHEVNRRLNSELPDDRFVTLAAIEVSPFSETISIVNAGLPTVFLATRSGEVKECVSQCLPLGITQGAGFSFKPYVFALSELESLLMYSDGLIEQENIQGKSITLGGLRRALKDYTKKRQSWKSVANVFTTHRGQTTLADDVTVCAINFDELELNTNNQDSSEQRNGNIAFALDISGDFLRSVDAPAFVSKFLYAAGIEGKLAGKTFTAIAELYQNGLDHGVLELPSELKNDIEGFASYMEQREASLQALGENDRVKLSLSFNAANGLTASIVDTGKGYDTGKVNPEQFSLYGRGLALVRQLSESFETNRSGNHVSIQIKE